MKRLAFSALAAAGLLAAASLGLTGSEPATAQKASDNRYANHPDEVAWETFIDVVSPAPDGTGRTSPAFTTWAGDIDTFRADARWPLRANGLSVRPTVLPRIVGTSAHQREATAAAPAAQRPTWNEHLLHDVAVEEVRRNRASFDYIVQNRLNVRSGLIAAFERDISFPVGAVEVKTNWLPVEQVPLYYRNSDGSPLTQRQVGELFFITEAVGGGRHALLSMHVMSKQVPDWTWATFEHHLNPARCDIIGCTDAYGATVPVVEPQARQGGNYGRCEHTRPLLDRMGRARVDRVFANYCLKGSQTNFIDRTGLPVRVGNSVTEGGFVESSSCMTCHGTAGWNPDGTALPINAVVGAIDPQTFWRFGGRAMPGRPGVQRPSSIRMAASADYVWSIPFCVYDDTVQAPGARPATNPCYDARDPGR